jgi:hypothetical protein
LFRFLQFGQFYPALCLFHGTSANSNVYIFV